MSQLYPSAKVERVTCSKPQSGERIQPTACPELAEGAQAVGYRVENDQAPEGRKRSDDPLSAGQPLRLRLARLLVDPDHISGRVAEPRGNLGSIRTDCLRNFAPIRDDQLERRVDAVDHDVNQ